MSVKLAVLDNFARIASVIKQFNAGKPKNMQMGFYADLMNLEFVESELNKLRAQASAIVQIADEEGRELTSDEIALADEIATKVKSFETRQRVLSIGARAPGAPGAPASAGRRTGPQAPQAPAVVQAGNLEANALTGGEYFVAARALRAGANNALTKKLSAQMATDTYANESVGADGGFLVPPDMRREIWQKVLEGDTSLLRRTNQQVSTSNSLSIPTDETTPWGTAGVQVFWNTEGGVIPESKPVFGRMRLDQNKLTALVPVSEEMMQDAPFIDGYIRSRVPQALEAKVNEAILRGDGVGKPLGILNSTAIVTVAKEGTQPADTVWYENIVNMWVRMAPQCRARGIWLVSPQVETQLLKLAFVAGAASPVPAYMPAGGLSGEPFGTLMGRPVIPVQDASALGDKGDIMFVDLTQYMVATHGQLRTDSSIHFFFNQDATAIRFVLRLAGQPMWSAPIQQKNSPDALSCFVTLADRG